jgi:hypothetical protein
MQFTIARYNALLAESEIIEEHFHGDERWYGKAKTADGEIHVADLISLYTKTSFVIAPFQLDAGDDGWGAWVQLLGSSDTPMEVGKTKFDFHKMLIVAAEQTLAQTFIQIASGTSGAAGLTAKTYTTIGYHTAVNHGSQGAVQFMFKRHVAGTKCWGRTLSIGKNTGTIDFYIGLHEY